MKLRSVRIRHYKSLDDVVLDVNEGVTLLVGQNAVGKSNVVDCLRFVRDAVGIDLEHAVSYRGGISRVRQYSKTKPYKVGVRLDFRQDDLPTSLAGSHYEFSVESLTASNYVVDHEAARFFEVDREDGQPVTRSFTRDRTGDLRVSGREERPIRLSPDQLALGSRSPLYGGLQLERYIRDWRFSSIYPNRLREPSTPDKDNVLAEDGRNWASVIKALRRTARGRQALERISEAIRAVIPTFLDVSVSSVGSYLVPNFRFSLKGKDTVTFDPVQLSDGTLRIFGMLLAIYQSPAPRLLVIEEPEQTVHPGVLGVLADAFKEAAEATQIIITTHSPHLVDYFKPEEVRVVSLQEGLTTVERVRKTQVEAVKRRLMSLQEFMLAEGLQGEIS